MRGAGCIWWETFGRVGHLLLSEVSVREEVSHGRKQGTCSCHPPWWEQWWFAPCCETCPLMDQYPLECEGRHGGLHSNGILIRPLSLHTHTHTHTHVPGLIISSWSEKETELARYRRFRGLSSSWIPTIEICRL